MAGMTTAGWFVLGLAVATAIAFATVIAGGVLGVGGRDEMLGSLGPALLSLLLYLPLAWVGAGLHLVVFRRIWLRRPDRRTRATAMALSPLFSLGFLLFMVIFEPNELLTPWVLYLLVVPSLAFGLVVPPPPASVS